MSNWSKVRFPRLKAIQRQQALQHSPPQHQPLYREQANCCPQLRDLLAFALEHAVAAQIAEAPELAAQAKALATAARKANTLKALDELLAELKRFAFRLELLADDRAELRNGLLHLLNLVIENISELVIDDNWLHGQIAVVRDIVEPTQPALH